MNRDTLPQMLVHACASFSERIALIDVANNKEYSYKELGQLAKAVAHHLSMHGSTYEEIVPLCIKNKCHQVIAILGCWLAGKAYCPIEKNSPIERIHFIIHELASQNIITDDFLLGTKLNQIRIQDILDASTILPKMEPVYAASKDLAYVIYTSGSTGKPKGVMVEHSSLKNLIESLSDIKPLIMPEYMIQNCSYAFDPSLWVIFWPLLYGSTLLCPSEEQTKSPKELCTLLTQFKVHTLHAGPAYLKLLLDEPCFKDCTEIKTIIGGGEAWNYARYEEMRNMHPHIDLYNVYGPTETCIHVTSWKFDKNLSDKKNIPIGKPIQNVAIHLLDEHGQLTEQSGEIAVSGIALARGYLANPSLTEEQFIQVMNKKGQWLRLYKTGDYGSFNEHGELLYRGRLDRQIKISGYRIELDEIESVVRSQKEIKECTVIVSTQTGNPLIIAFVVFADLHQKKKEEALCILEKNLKQMIPSYMLPNHYIILEKLPLNDRLKIDKDALEHILERYREEQQKDSTHKDFALELKTLWQTVLKTQDVQDNDDFFASGGDSLKAIKLLSMINHVMKANFQFSMIFEHRTFQALNSFLEKNRPQNEQSLSSKTLPEHWPLSKNQLRLVTASKQAKMMNNAVRTFQLNCAMDVPLFEQAIHKIFKEHALLQAQLIKNEEQDYFIFNLHKIVFSYHDLSHKKDPKSCIQENHDAYLHQEIDLYSENLFSTKLLKLEEQKYILLIYLNHIIMDTESSDIVIEDIFKYYFNKTSISFASKTTYLDYVNEQSKLYETFSTKDYNYWVDKLAFKKRMINFHISPDNESIILIKPLHTDLIHAIRIFLTKEKITAFQFFIALFQLTLYKLTKEPQFAVGFTYSKRNKEAYSRVVGPMSSKAILMFNNEKTDDLNAFLHEISTNINQLFGFMHLDYEDIRKKINDIEGVEQDLFNILFDYTAEQNLSINECIQTFDMHNINKIKRHLSFRVIDKGSAMQLCIRARKSIGMPFIEKLYACFIENVAKACDSQLLKA